MAITHMFGSSEFLRRWSLWSRWTAATIADEGLGFVVPALAGAFAYAAGPTDWWSVITGVAVVRLLGTRDARQERP